MPLLNIPASTKWSETEIERNIHLHLAQWKDSERFCCTQDLQRRDRVRACATICGLPVTDAPWPINEEGTDQPAREGHDVTSTHTRTHAHTRTIGSSAHDIWAKTIIVRTGIQMTAHFNGPVGPWPVNLSTLANPGGGDRWGRLCFPAQELFDHLKNGGWGVGQNLKKIVGVTKTFVCLWSVKIYFM